MVCFADRRTDLLLLLHSGALMGWKDRADGRGWKEPPRRVLWVWGGMGRWAGWPVGDCWLTVDGWRFSVDQAATAMCD